MAIIPIRFTMSTTSTKPPRGKPAQRSVARKASPSAHSAKVDAASDQAALEAVVRTMDTLQKSGVLRVGLSVRQGG